MFFIGNHQVFLATLLYKSHGFPLLIKNKYQKVVNKQLQKRIKRLTL